MKYPYWEKRGWKFQKTSYSAKNTKLAKEGNKKRGFVTKEVKLKLRPSGSKYIVRALLTKPKGAPTTNLQKFKKQLADAKKVSGSGFVSKLHITNDPAVIKYMKKNKISCNKMGKDKVGRRVSFIADKPKNVVRGMDTRPKFDFKKRKWVKG